MHCVELRECEWKGGGKVTYARVSFQAGENTRSEKLCCDSSASVHMGRNVGKITMVTLCEKNILASVTFPLEMLRRDNFRTPARKVML